MEKRTLEAEEFFQEQEEEYTPSSALIKSDDSEDGDWTETVKETKPAEATPEIPEISENSDTQMNECQETEILPPASEPLPMESNASEIAVEYADVTANISGGEDNENITENQMTEEQLTESNPTHTLEFHTDRTDLDDELDALIENDNARPKPSIPTDFVPKLKGQDGFVIDLETNDLKPKSQDGIYELFDRFIKNACVKKSAAAETQNVGYIEIISVFFFYFNL